MGAASVVAGTNINEMIKSIKELNSHGISCTIDNLGEFVHDKAEATAAKNQILAVIEAVNETGVDAHISLKPSQLGLDIDYDFCYENLKEIVELADRYDIFVNFDMENYARLQPSFDLLEELSREHDNIGTVIQAYFFRAKEDIEKYKNYRLRIVKGAYKEPSEVAYQTKEEIDRNYIELLEYHLLNGKFTSIATHDTVSELRERHHEIEDFAQEDVRRLDRQPVTTLTDQHELGARHHLDRGDGVGRVDQPIVGTVQEQRRRGDPVGVRQQVVAHLERPETRLVVTAVADPGVLALRLAGELRPHGVVDGARVVHHPVEVRVDEPGRTPAESVQDRVGQLGCQPSPELRRPALEALGQTSGGDEDEAGHGHGMTQRDVHRDVATHRDAGDGEPGESVRARDSEDQVGQLVDIAGDRDPFGIAESGQIGSQHQAVLGQRLEDLEPGDGGVVVAAAVDQQDGVLVGTRVRVERSATQDPDASAAVFQPGFGGTWREQPVGHRHTISAAQWCPHHDHLRGAFEG